MKGVNLSLEASNAGAVRLVFQDEHVLVVSKPAGVLCHPVSPRHKGTLTQVLSGELGLGAVHLVSRLDRDTSGLLLVAKRREVHHLLQQDPWASGLRRQYLAVAAGHLPLDIKCIHAPIGRHPDHEVLRAVREDGARAVTHVEVLEYLGGATLLQLELETGRTHQIRVHLQHLGHPLLGDQWYGQTRLDLIPRQALHSAALSLLHPLTGARLEFTETLPEDMRRLFETLKSSDA